MLLKVYTAIKDKLNIMSNKSNSPQGGKRGCLCDDGKTYSKDCCKGELKNQGIGSLVGQGASSIVNTNSPRTITS